MNTVLLNARGITKRFGALTVLDRVDFKVCESEAIGVVGPNGAGKSTLMNALSGTYALTEGSVELLGEDVSWASAAIRCHKGISKTHQIPLPFLGMTVFENVFVAAAHGASAKGDEAYELAYDALKISGMLDISNRRAEEIGLLDRKRLELARALATRPKVLLLDEIGGGLTDAEASELVNTIRELLNRGISIVWIEHIVHVLLQVVGRLVCMDAGKIIADGDPSTVMKDKAVVEAYLGKTPDEPY